MGRMSEAHDAELAAQPPWLPRATDDGSWTLVHTVHGQACHSSSGAWLEARERYARPCRIRELARRGGEVRVLDVGTGLGLNVAAALEACDGTAARLAVESLELDPGVLFATLATLAADGAAPEAEPWHGLVGEALARALADPAAAVGGVPLGRGDRDGRAGTLHLVLGDARETVLRWPEEPRWDAVFLDPFSPAGHPDLWEPAFLAALAARMAPGAILSTYTTSLAVRAGLERAGLRCGPGPRVGAKHQGTLALRDAAPPQRFDERTARKLARRVARLSGPKALSGQGGAPGELSAGRRVQKLPAED